MSDGRQDYRMIIAPTKATRPRDFPEKMDAADFIGFMCQQFRVFHKEGSPEEAQWSDAMIAVLSVYPDEVLADGCLWFWQHRKESRFPLSAEIITVCDEIAKEKRRPTLLREEGEAKKSDPWSRERAAMVKHLLGAGPMGKQAEREGWIGALGDYVRRHGKLPEWKEVPALVDASRLTTQTIEAVYRGDGFAPGMLLEACRSAADSIQKRRREYAAMATGDYSDV